MCVYQCSWMLYSLEFKLETTQTSINRRMGRHLLCIHTMEYSSAGLAITWNNLKNIILNERRQTLYDSIDMKFKIGKTNVCDGNQNRGCQRGLWIDGKKPHENSLEWWKCSGFQCFCYLFGCKCLSKTLNICAFLGMWILPQ